MLSRTERENIEVTGVPVAVAILIWLWGITVSNIEMITDKKRQYKGIDWIIWDDERENNIKIDTKFHVKKAKKQSYTDYGVDLVSIEITKANGLKGWGINPKLENDYIIDIINNYGFYIIDSEKLHSFMADNYNKYPIMYKAKGKEDYRAVSVKELIAEEIIIDWIEWEEIEEVINMVREDESYKENIEPLLNKLITHK